VLGKKKGWREEEGGKMELMCGGGGGGVGMEEVGNAAVDKL